MPTLRNSGTGALIRTVRRESPRCRSIPPARREPGPRVPGPDLSPVHSRLGAAPRVDLVGRGARRGARDHLRGVVALPGAPGGDDGLGVDPGRRALDHRLPGCSRRPSGRGSATILENNIVQTTGSAGESIAFGVGVTMPALMILGYDMDLARVMLVAALGGLLGILMMIPLRRAFIVKQHGRLDVSRGDRLRQGPDRRRAGRARTPGRSSPGSAWRSSTRSSMQALKLWQEYPAKAIQGFKAAVVALEASPILMGVGYIIGFRIACVMVGGGLLAALVLTPGDRPVRRRRDDADLPGDQADRRRCARRRSATPTSSTSAPGRSRPAGSSASSRRCR